MTPQVWTSLKLRALDLAEVADAWRIGPRAIVGYYLMELYSMTGWYRGLADPTSAQTSFVCAVWGFFMPVFTAYVATGRRWTT